MTNFETAPTPREYAERTLVHAEGVLRDAVAIAFPETPDIAPALAFPKPTELRAESPDIPELTDERKAALLAKAAELGFGRAENVTLSEQGLTNATAILEGGQPHKMLAEARVVIEDTDAAPWLMILSASPHRVLTNQDEIASAERLFGRVGRTEYDVARDVVHSLHRFGFVPLAEPHALAYGYEVENDEFAKHDGHTGQFVSIGNIGMSSVWLMQINRREIGDGYEQPGTTDVIKITDSILRDAGDTTSPIAHVTAVHIAHHAPCL